MSNEQKQFWSQLTARVAPWTGVIIAVIAGCQMLNDRTREALVLGHNAVANSTNAVHEIKALRSDVRVELREINQTLRTLNDQVIVHGVQIRELQKNYDK